MAELAASSGPQIVPLAVFVRLRRPHETKSRCQWARDAATGKIPGAFRFDDRGQWYVSLDTYDDRMRKLSAQPSPTPDADLLALAASLGLNQDDLLLAMRAART